MAKKAKARELREELTRSLPYIVKDTPEQVEKAFGYYEGYKVFLDGGKTERERVEAGVKMLKRAGYKPFDRKASYEPRDKVYHVNRGKALIAIVFGRKPLIEGVGISGTHTDSPRLDLEPNPSYEKEEITYFKTHYYGGIRKYQWGTIPPTIHGIMVKKNGETVEVCIGEKESDPVFCVTDLLPHLSVKQNERPSKDGPKGEELNIVVGSLPFQDEEIKEPFKFLALSLLNERYGITEKDFFRAEPELAPAVKARDVGLDASTIGAYGQDDRVCAYTALTAEIDIKKPAHTTVIILADKEETGSDGNTGPNSDYVLHYVEDLVDQVGVKVRDILRNSLYLSSDMNAVYNPAFPDVCESRNSSHVNKGCVLIKHTGARGKLGSNDISAEVMAKVISMMEQEGVYRQAGELDVVGVGRGGAIAKFVAYMNVDTVGLGVSILSTHSPFELVPKLDVYNTYKAFKAFYK